jgi:hypothetical protein
MGDETAMDEQLIWVNLEGKYFCEWGWTGETPNCPSRLGKYSIASKRSRKSISKIALAAQKILLRADRRTARRTAFYVLLSAPGSCPAPSGKSVD